MWCIQVEKYIGMPITHGTMSVLVSDSPGWVRSTHRRCQSHWCSFVKNSYYSGCSILFVILVAPIYGTLACEEGPVSSLTSILRVPAHGRCSVNRWLDLSEVIVLSFC